MCASVYVLVYMCVCIYLCVNVSCLSVHVCVYECMRLCTYMNVRIDDRSGVLAITVNHLKLLSRYYLRHKLNVAF